MELKERIEKLLSDILSDKYECKVTLRFVPKEEGRGEVHQYEKAQ